MSKRFIAIAIFLTVLTLVGVLFILTILRPPYEGDPGFPERPGVNVTNAFVQTAIAETATAKSYTATPHP